MSEIGVGDRVEWFRDQYDGKYFSGTVLEIHGHAADVRSDQDGIRHPLLSRLKLIKDKDMKQEEQFWVIWNPEGRNPSYKHNTSGAAIEEAQRLARLNPGQSFYVLHAETLVRTVDVEVIKLAENIPF